MTQERSILDSLNIHIAVLDAHGVITATNHTWDLFARDNSSSPAATLLGSNYFAACTRAAEHGDETARHVLACMREVLSGERDAFTLEYPCHSPAWHPIHETGVWQGEIWNRRKNGEIYPEWLTISALRDTEGHTRNYVGVFSDITWLIQSEEKREHRAHHDALTDLPNRLLLHSRLEHAMDKAKRRDRRVAVLFLDLDR